MGVVESSTVTRSRVTLMASHSDGGGYPVLELSGEADLATEAVLGEALAEAVAMGQDHLVVDVTGLRFCGVRSAHMILTACRPTPVRVIGASGSVKRVIDHMRSWQERSPSQHPA